MFKKRIGWGDKVLSMGVLLFLIMLVVFGCGSEDDASYDRNQSSRGEVVMDDVLSDSDQIPHEASAVDAELYRPRTQDYCAHKQKDAENPWEWWYFDVIADNGYSLVNIWMLPVTPKIRSPYGTVALDISDPEGNHQMLENRYWKRQVKLSYDKLDIIAGDSYLRGEWPVFEIHYEFKRGSLDLVFESLTQGVMEPPDGCFIGRDLPPATRINMGWVISMPRAKVTGTLTLDGEEIPVNGTGYHDHQWGAKQLIQGALRDSAIFEYWYWGRVHLPNHTLVYWDGQLSPELGSVRHKRLVVLEGDRLVDYTTDGIYTDVVEIVTNERTGIDYHSTLEMTFDTDVIQGKLLMKPTKDLGQWIFPPRSGYVRYICDGEADLDILGEYVNATVEMTNELIFLNNQK